MAEIKATTSEKVFQITTFLGLNQNPDGDTKLKLGEAAVMDNFRITRDRNLQRRPGTKTVVNIGRNEPIKGLWVGYVRKHQYMLGACNGKLYRFWDDESTEFAAVEIGSISTDKDVCIFAFDDIVYVLDGQEYRKWDGESLEVVSGYRPLVKIAISPINTEDKSAVFENINRLTGKRRIWLSPDGNGVSFAIPEKPESLEAVKSATTLDNIPSDTYSYDNETGLLTFTSAPAGAENSIEVWYDVGNDLLLRSQVTSMQYAELFSGTNDTRVFLYGDGSNKTIYSGLAYSKPSAEYFPDLYEAEVGDENTPITGMIRHYSSLACFKADSAWSITASTLTTAEGLNIPAFYVTPVNKTIGLTAMGQVRLVMNSPYTVFGNDCYEWKNSSYYTSNLTRDERQAKRISDRVYAAISKFDLKRCYCYDDNSAQEYYICYDGKALVYNYAADAWSRYTAFPVSCMANIGDELYIGGTDGKLRHFNYKYEKDDNMVVNSYWESGSMGFGQDYMRKYSAMLWIGIKPEPISEVNVTVITDKSNTMQEKVVSSSHFSFSIADFRKWTFKLGSRPTMKRLKIKAKKFVFYKLVFKCNSENAKATIVAADIRVRYTGMTK